MNIKDRIIEFKRVPANQLRPNPRNWRTHPEGQKTAMKAMLEEVGFVGAVLARKNDEGNLETIDGHLRQDLCLDAEVPVLVVDVTEEEALKILATYDPISAMAGVDDDTLRGLVSDLEFDNTDAQAFIDDLAKQNGIEEDAPDITEDESPSPSDELLRKWGVEPGQLWELGDHRLLCGDSTKVDDVERLMGGEKASLVFTDPPYGVSFQSNMRTSTEKFKVLENDDKILDGWIPPVIAHSRGWVFVWTTWKVLEQWLPVVKPFGDMSNLIVWNKGGGGIGDLKKTFSTDHELALVFHRGAEICGKRIGSVWSFSKDAAASYMHPTQKPVALAAEAIDKTTVSGSVVMDVFLGSGTTLMAAEQLNRKCYGMEISPAYCAVIIERWHNLTGKEPVILSHD